MKLSIWMISRKKMSLTVILLWSNRLCETRHLKKLSVAKRNKYRESRRQLKIKRNPQRNLNRLNNKVQSKLKMSSFQMWLWRNGCYKSPNGSDHSCSWSSSAVSVISILNSPFGRRSTHRLMNYQFYVSQVDTGSNSTTWASKSKWKLMTKYLLIVSCNIYFPDQANNQKGGLSFLQKH
jgi:hypothetical protein